jgi:hypothetical protein
MQIPQSSSPESLPMAGASLEAIYLSHILETMKELRWCFKDKDVETFSLYIEYLKSATLGEMIQSQMDKDISKLKERLKKENVNSPIKDFRVGFLVVKEVMKYLNTSLDLTHEDIIGQAYDIEDLPEEQITLDQIGDDGSAADSPV